MKMVEIRCRDWEYDGKRVRELEVNGWVVMAYVKEKDTEPGRYNIIFEIPLGVPEELAKKMLETTAQGIFKEVDD